MAILDTEKTHRSRNRVYKFCHSRWICDESGFVMTQREALGERNRAVVIGPNKDHMCVVHLAAPPTTRWLNTKLKSTTKNVLT